MKRLNLAFFTIILGIGLIFGDLRSLYAQDEEFTLEEIVVTADKREADVQKTAMEITAVLGDDINTRAITDVTEVLDGLAAINVMGGAMGNKIFIRGIGSSLDSDTASPSVTLQKDNVYMGNGEDVLSTLFDIERVEVLYGPQGTMYGKNATGGTVNIISRNPTDKFEASANLTIGYCNERNWGATLNVPFSSKFAARLAFNQQKHDAYLTDGSGTTDIFGTRVKLSYKPSDKLSILLTSEWAQDKSKQMNTVPVPGSAGNLSPMDPWSVPDVDNDGVADDFLSPDPNDPGSFINEPNGIPDIVDTGWLLPPGGDEWSNDEWHPAPLHDWTYQINSLQVDLDMGWSKLTFIPTMNKNHRFVVNDFMDGIATGLRIYAPGTSMGGWEETQYTAEARLANSEDSRLIWTLGAYWNKSENIMITEQYSDLMDQAEDTWLHGSTGMGPPTPAFLSNKPITQTIREPQVGYSFFGQATYPVTDRFRITGGLRKNNDPSTTKYRIIIYNVTQDGVYGTDTTVTGYISNLYDQTVEVTDPTAPGGVRHVYDTGIAVHEVQESPFTYTGGLEFDLAENRMLYGTYKTGFKKGGLNYQTSVPPQSFDPETVKAYTLGIKNRFMNNQLQLNVEAYYYDYNGYQVQCFTTYWDELMQSTQRAMLIINAEKGTNSGLDLSMDLMVTAYDRVSASAAYMKTECGAIVLPANPLAGSAEMELTGTDLPQAPQWSGTLAYDHVFMLDGGATITPSLRTKISAGYWNVYEKYLPESYTDGFTQSSFYINYADASGKYTVSLWGKNLENEAITQYVFPKYRKFVSEPRTTGITFSVRF